jgi:LPS export ABC transporter permease LptG
MFLLRRPWRAIDGYLIGSALPYVLLSLTILSAILLIQQTAKFAEVLDSAEAPMRLTLEVAANILPSILIFTLPTSVLVGTATGFGQLGQDSELVAIRAAGVGTLRIIAPLMFLGTLLSFLNFYVAFEVSPVSAQNLRDIGLQAALYRLESPVEPRSFYTGMPGKVVYVREGDKEKGLWGKIFIQWEEEGAVRLVTARSGRLDFSGEQAELVLEDALLTTLPPGGFEAFAKGAHVTIERSANMRLRGEGLDLGRGSITRRMREREPELDELGWSGLLERARNSKKPSEGREASMLLHRRLTLSLCPIIFAFFGAGLGLKVVRGGRSKGFLLSLLAMLLYYLLSLAGEQLGRAGTVPPVVGSWLAFFTAVCAGFLLLFTRRWSFNFPIYRPTFKPFSRVPTVGANTKEGGRYVALLGLLDKSIFNSLAANFLLIVSGLVSIFLIFTLFELIRFIAAHHTAPMLVVRYLLYLLPFACIAVTPAGALLSSLVTFALMLRRNESVAWWSSGQSVYRFLVPCLFFSALLGTCVWLLQDKVMPEANRRQNALRGVIRSGGAQTEAQRGRRWVASADSTRIYNYSPGPGGELADVVVFNFDREALHLERIYLAPAASLAEGRATLDLREAELVDFGGGGVTYRHQPRASVEAEAFEAFNSGLSRPMEFSYEGLSAYIKALKERGVNVLPLSVALQRRLVEPFLPLVMILVGSPLAFVFGRRGTLLALCFGIGVGLLFLGLMSIAQQVGSSGLISTSIAAWAPPALFTAAGLYMLSRTRT